MKMSVIIAGVENGWSVGFTRKIRGDYYGRNYNPTPASLRRVRTILTLKSALYLKVDDTSVTLLEIRKQSVVI